MRVSIILEFPKERNFVLWTNFKYVFIITLDVILVSNIAITEACYRTRRSFLLIQVHYSFGKFPFILPVTCFLYHQETCLWALGNKVFMGFHQGKEHRATDAALLVAPPPYPFQGVEERELGPTKGFSPSSFLSPVQQVDPRWAPDSWVQQRYSAPLFDHQLLSLPVCFSGLVSCPVH